ncbi:MAG: hypothetical protein WBD91_15600 [Acidobacteriaceae bacterium]
MQLSPTLAQTLTNLNLAPYPTVTGLPQSITTRSLASFAGALLWAWLLLVSFAGWGRLTGGLFRGPRLPASVACALGIAVIVFLGGWLNLLHAIYPSVLFAITGVGLLLYAASRRQRPEEYRWLHFWKNSSRGSKILIVIALLILVLRIAATVRLGTFNVPDDSTAYLVFPQKMLATHHFANDPFSDRRVISSLGGAYLLQCLAIAATSISHIAMADRTMGFMLLAAALFDIGVRFALSPIQIALLEFLVCLAPQETINLTFVVLPTSLLLAMIWLVVDGDQLQPSLRNACLIGVTGGAIVSLKSTYLPIVGVYAFLPFLAASWRARRLTRFSSPIIAGLSALGVLLAWMIAMKMTSGTYLFPVLGSGVDYTSYGLFHLTARFSTHRAFVKIFLQAFALSILIGVQIAVGIKNENFRISLLVLATSAIAITAFNYRSGGDFIWRYNFPQFLCAIVIFYAATGSSLLLEPSSTKARLAFYVGMLSLASMVFYYDAAGSSPRPFRQIGLEHKDYVTSLRASLTAVSLAGPSLNSEYQAIENSIPPRTLALENVARPYLFHYRQHNLYVMDWPGAASPPPGWPFGQSSAKLSSYLQQNSVRYVVYDYHYASWNDAASCVSLLRPKLYSTELYALFWMSVLSDHQLDQLRKDYRSIYDDGKVAVLDLNQPIPTASGNEPVWTTNTNKEEMCSVVLAGYLANPSVRTSTNSSADAESR